MRFLGWLLLLVACRVQSDPVTAMQPCPACATNRCADTSCPDCPACTSPTSPGASEDSRQSGPWYCHDWHRQDMPTSSYCRASERACEYTRQDVMNRKLGTVSPCVAHSTVHCFLVADPATMNRQRLCARTAENCERRRAWVKNHKPDATDNVGTCAPTLNVEPFPFEDEGPPTPWPETRP